MPIYDFICEGCGLRFECLVKIGKEKEVVCRDCGASRVRKLPSTFGIGGGTSRLVSSSSGCSSCSSKSCSTCK